MSEHTPGNPKCCGRVSSGSWGWTRDCTRTGSLEYEGDHYCKTHHPPTAKAKDDARRKEWEEKWEREKQARKQQADKTAERDRKAEEYDAIKAERDCLRAVNAELLEALEAYDAWADKTICTDVDLKKIREQMRAAIASARKQGEQG